MPRGRDRLNLKFDENRLIEFAKRVELASTHVLEGFHRSKRAGEGVEFQSLRPYTEGEDARRIDWKRYASSDRVVIRQYEREEKSSWKFIFDSSESMNFGEKKTYQQHLAGVFIFLAKVWGDSWVLEPDFRFVLEDAFEALLSNEAGLEPGQWNQVEGSSHSRLVVLSDFFVESSVLSEQVKLWSDEFRSLHFVQILDPKELSFDFRNVVRFEDRESEDRMTLDVGAAKKAYLAELKKHQEELRQLVEQQGSFHCFSAEIETLEESGIRFFEDLWNI